jgi:peptidoglycan/xylan/chitin deacetylase (PgdA/CDA1 family)
MNPISVALKGKGLFKLAQRTVSIVKSYGVTSGNKMDRALKQFTAILNRFECSATFPITAVALERNPQVIKKYQEQGIEFAIHGYRHVDHCQLSQTEQLAQLELAKQLFDSIGIPVQGFRGPYLHANSDTLVALQHQRLAYDSSQGLSWDILDSRETSAYRHVLDFYGALPASDYPSLPRLEGDLVRIPYSLPDDEALVHRLSLETTDRMNALWLTVLRRSYELGELFTLGLHPERIFICQEPLTAVLSEAYQLDPAVWIAQLDEIATWWRARNEAEVEITDTVDGKLRVTVMGPSGTTVLARGVELDAPTLPWADGYRQVLAMTFTVHAPLRPCIGLAPTASPELSSFVRQQGYIIELSERDHRCAYYLNQTDFTAEDQRPLLAHIEETGRPLVRLGRWPNGARSALAITGDIDALTLWDYGLRFLGR